MKHLYKFLFVILYGLLVFLTLNRHSRNEYFMYRSEIWSDKAGYYIYQPVWLHYGLHQRAYPADIVGRTGFGFSFDSLTGLMQNKYTCGVAMMQMPFTLIASAFGAANDEFPVGFTPLHHTMINIAGISWLWFGLLFLFLFLREYVSDASAFTTILLVLIATNLFNYGVFETGMSHVYSFALAAYSLWAWNQFFTLEKKTFLLIISIGLVSGLLVLIRPTNLLIVGASMMLCFLHSEQRALKGLLQLKVLALMALAALLMFIPQIVFWHITTGHFVHYSYGDEGFIWSRPMLSNILFAPNNGLLLYSPFVAILVLCAGYLSWKRQWSGIIPLSLFALTAYIFSCWWDYDFGCTFGYRSYIEYYPLLSLPFALCFSRVYQASKIFRFSFYTLLVIAAGIRLKLTYTWPSCYQGAHFGDWNWEFYREILLGPPL